MSRTTSRGDGGNRLKRRLLSAGLAALLVAAVAAPAQARPTPGAVDVVVVAAGSRSDAAQRLTRRLGGRVHRRLAIIDGFTASVPRRAVERLADSPAVRSLSRDSRMRVSSAGDPGAGAAAASTAFLRSATGARALDANGHAGAGVDVAVLDSGVVGVGGFGAPGALVTGPDFSSERHVPTLNGMDTFGHGTHVAGVIAGSDPLTGFEGVAPAARIVSVKVAGADGATSLGRVLRGYDWIYRHGRSGALNVRVLNVSLGVQDPDGYRRDPLAWASERLWESGIAVVAAAGNDGAEASGLDLPAADPFVIAVGATEGNGLNDPSDDAVADYSSRDAARPPDVVAPGSRIVSLRVPGSTLDAEFPQARVGDGFFRGSGTSQAAAVVSGLSARLIGQRPDLTPDQLKLILRAGAVDLAEPASADGAGRVDAAASAALATPSPEDAAQHGVRAILDLSRIIGPAPGSGPDADVVVAGNVEWAGRRWSGRRWSGMNWAGMKWSGRRWSSEEWAGG